MCSVSLFFSPIRMPEQNWGSPCKIKLCGVGCLSSFPGVLLCFGAAGVFLLPRLWGFGLNLVLCVGCLLVYLYSVPLFVYIYIYIYIFCHSKKKTMWRCYYGTWIKHQSFDSSTIRYWILQWPFSQNFVLRGGCKFIHGYECKFFVFFKNSVFV